MADGGQSLAFAERPDTVVRLSDDKAELVEEKLRAGALARERLARERARRQWRSRATASAVFIVTTAVTAGVVLAVPRVLGWQGEVPMPIRTAGLPQASAALVPPAPALAAASQPALSASAAPVPAPSALQAPLVQPSAVQVPVIQGGAMTPQSVPPQSVPPQSVPVVAGEPAPPPALAAPPAVVAAEPPSSAAPPVEPQVMVAGVGDSDQRPPVASPTPGLLLVARQGDTLQRLYRLVYTGVQAPPFADVEQVNPAPVRTGSVLVFPTPTGGWRRP